MTKSPTLLKDALFSFIAGAVLGSLLAAFSPPPFWQGFFGGFVLSTLVCFALIRTWRWSGSEKMLGIIMLTAFVLRIGLGALFLNILPSAGYADSAVQKAGYVYSDAYERDQAAIQLVQSGQSVFTPFLNQLKSDQYGGLLTISALMYLIFSPDTARPLLITLLGGFTMTIGLAFFWAALKQRFSSRFALIASWVLALYPEGVLLGASQMREPFLMGLGCIAFWSALQWKEQKLKAFLTFAASLVGMVLFSPPAGMVIGGTCLALVLLEFTIETETIVNRWTGIEVLTLLGFAAFISGWMWLQPTLYYEVYSAKMASGMLQYLFDLIPATLTVPFVTVYGLLQPVLPAAIVEPSVPFWTILGIIRAGGWYFMLPFLLYSLFALWKSAKQQNGWILVLVGVVFFAWTVVSSARAAGDQWDNPRYRAILLPFMAMVFTWVWLRVRQTHSSWFWRWVAVVAVLTIGFTNWYFSRTWGVGIYMSFFTLVADVAVISTLILLGGAIWDWTKKRKGRLQKDLRHG